jgi:hypothetical protein
MGTEKATLSGDVRAQLRYLRRDVAAETPPHPAVSPESASEHEVEIRDARPFLTALSLDQHGFVLRKHRSEVVDFYDPGEVKARYYPELERLIKDSTGAVKAVVFAHDVRCAPKAGASGVREPVQAVHNDYTPVSGPQHVSELLPRAEAAERLERRFIELNLWRPIRGPVMDMPLAVCEAGSIAARDLLVVELKHEVYMVAYNPAHRWFYFPMMTADEVILIKGYDSSIDGRARFTAHSAFRDPRCPLDAPPRESIEARILAFF